MKVVFSFSLALLLTAMGLGQTNYKDLAHDIETSKDSAKVAQKALDSDVEVYIPDTKTVAKLKEIAAGKGELTPEIRSEVAATARALSIVSGEASAEITVKPDVVKEIKSSPIYSDAGEREAGNWLDESYERVRKLLSRIKWPESNKGQTMSGDMPGWVSTLVVALLVAGLGFILFIVGRTIQWKRAFKRKVGAMLDEDEPVYTLDEWLEKADAFVAEGRYREAVRALYLACLLRFDEHQVAKFKPGQTNWEHLSRIQSSPKKPQSIDFRPATMLFDRVWYGSHVRGIEDVNMMRDNYLTITETLGCTK